MPVLRNLPTNITVREDLASILYAEEGGKHMLVMPLTPGFGELQCEDECPAKLLRLASSSCWKVKPARYPMGQGGGTLCR
jgi:hypothetical protein